MAKKRAAKRRGDPSPTFVIRENKTGTYLKDVEGAVTMTPIKAEASLFVTDAAAREAAVRYLTNNYRIEPQ